MREGTCRTYGAIPVRLTASNHKPEMELLELQKSAVYGPIESRRLGRSLGVNLLPADCKICSFNCCYCQYGWTPHLLYHGRRYQNSFPSVESIKRAVGLAFNGPKHFDYVTFSGNGEPTLHPYFPQIVDAITTLKADLRPQVRSAILSNGAMCGAVRINKSLQKIDLPIMKLDAGNERMFKKLNRAAAPITLQGIVDGLKTLDRFAMQTMFVQGMVNNSTDVEVESWLEKLDALKPLWVQIYSLDRGTPNPGLEKVPFQRLMEIAHWATSQTGVKVEVY
ncbi:radical SAM protein [bacterium]|nr:radical SAM protein [bacterium]